MVQYYQDSADKGNVPAQTVVGQVLNYGTHGMQVRACSAAAAPAWHGHDIKWSSATQQPPVVWHGPWGSHGHGVDWS